MICGVLFFDGDENSTASRANFPAGSQCSFNRRPIICEIDNLRRQKNRRAGWSRPDQFNRIFCRHGTWRAILFRPPHQLVGRRPIAMAIEQRADHAAIQYSGKSLILFLWFPFCYDYAVFRKTTNTQPVRVRRPTAPACVVRRVLFLKGLRAHLGLFARRARRWRPTISILRAVREHSRIRTHLWPNVKRARPNETVVVVLFCHVRAPACNARRGKDRRV
jgi:hypothetical protein